MALDRQGAKEISVEVEVEVEAERGGSSDGERDEAKQAILKALKAFFDARTIHLPNIYSALRLSSPEFVSRELIVAELRVSKAVSAMLAEGQA